MRKNLKALAATLLLAGICATALAACGSGNQSNETSAAVETSAGESKEASSSGVSISLLNSKGEIQTALEDLAKTFEAETGIHLDVIACGAGESPYTRITSMYQSGTAPTMAILDNTDVIALAKEYALDLSDSEWIKEAGDNVAKIDGKVYSFPFCVEGRGIIYNKGAIEDTLGRDFDPDSINSLDSFKAILEELRANGMENPVVLSKEDWSLGAHQLGFIYDTYDGTTEGSAKIIDALKDGSQKAIEYNRFNEFIDTLDVLKEYNVNKADPLGAIYEEDPIHLVDGDSAFWANGTWAWPNIKDAGAGEDEEYGFIPFVLENDTSDFANNGIQASPSKQLMVDNDQASEEQKAAAKEFIDWLVYSESGQKGLVEECALIPACTNNTITPLDPLGKDVSEKLKAGKTFSSSFIAPGDHWSVIGASVQKYVANQSDRAELADELDAYWTSQK